MTGSHQSLASATLPAERHTHTASTAEKYERLAFTFCKMGTLGLLSWLLTPPVFVLLVAAVAIILYSRALSLGLTRSRCFLRKPLLIIGFWSVVAAADVVWLLAFVWGR
jgi:hypothetical protein